MSDRVLMSPPDVGPLEEEYVLRAMRSGWVAPAGPDIAAFEREVAEFCDVSHAVALSSGTAALHLAMLAVGVGPGDVVIVATMTFVATANAVTYTGATPYFVDVLEGDGNLDPELLQDAIQETHSLGLKVGAVIAVDMLGSPSDYSAISKVCEQHGVPLIEDAAEALGASHSGTAAGAFGRAAALSFNGNKIMTTSGGGMLLSSDEELIGYARHLSTQARQPVVHYEHEEVGFNYRLSNILAALGRAQLARLPDMIQRRREIRHQYAALVDEVPGVRILGGEDREANCWLTALVIDPDATGTNAAEVLEALERANIEARPLWKPMHLQPVFSDAARIDVGVSNRLFARGATLPSGSKHNEQDIARVIAVLAEHFGARS